MLLKYFLLWFPMIFIAIINGIIRQGFYLTFLDELSAHQLSVLSGIIFFSIYIWSITNKWELDSYKQTILIGFMWLIMTILFEFVFGHYVMGHSWEKLLHDYNFFAGRLWVIVLLWITISPTIFYHIHKKKF